jgi:lactate permease
LFKLELLVAAGTAILFAAVITKFIARISWRDWAATFGETLKELKYALATIASVVGLAYVANASGMSTTLGMTLAATGALFPFFSPVLGWLGVFLTGSDTSSNLLFGNLQKVTATELGMDPALAIAANSSGGVTGKMISPQSIAVACAAVGLTGRDADLFRFTIKHSIALVLVICVLTYLQTNWLAWMLP